VRRPALLGAAIAVLAAGCGALETTAGSLTCGELRDGVSFREQARLLVDTDQLQARTLSTERSVLDAEQHLRRACRGAADDDQPYDRTSEDIPGTPALSSTPPPGG
jgi:hypothetical protein